jgi:hypothetical protein
MTMRSGKARSTIEWFILFVIAAEFCARWAFVSLAQLGQEFSGHKSPDITIEWIVIWCAIFGLFAARLTALPLVTVALADFVCGLVIRTQMRDQSVLTAVGNSWWGLGFLCLALGYLFLSGRVWPFRMPLQS